MKKLLISQNEIIEIKKQYNNKIKIVTENFSGLVNFKSGTIKPYILNEDWPKWRANVDSNYAFKLAAGDDMNEIPSWFEEAGKTFDALETEMNSAGNVKEPNDQGQYTTWDKWLLTSGLGKVVNMYSSTDGSENSDSPFNMWNKNVVANKKSATWKTKDGMRLIHANTFESFDSWLSSGNPGLIIRVCSSDSKNPSGSCNKEYVWNIGNPITTK